MSTILVVIFMLLVLSVGILRVVQARMFLKMFKEMEEKKKKQEMIQESEKQSKNQN
ncbi:MAG: hypothetical protein US50_C0004G0018 [Candidatus Nomurabacteria bacterium GW2011_GWB1_37_5]|uniref:Uncharacterized protein n=1 Tax=Candidatus Nomurabacteria bacterium GW2011_GWB1_37_5 TaxID=1618742 RepID=A0A0G0JGA3_9BACT|nr:MAG: hypothetical protein US50_C0004G0018 [Candidatus Nomurabacteria bacterium GW2011_GWB1_37_5]